MTRHLILNTLKHRLEAAGLSGRVWGNDAPNAVQAFLGLMGEDAALLEKYALPIEVVYQSSNDPLEICTTAFPADPQPLPFPLKDARATAKVTQVMKIFARDGVTVTNWRGFADVQTDGKRVEQMSSVYAPLRDHIDLESKIVSGRKIDDGILLFYDSSPDNFCHFVLDWVSALGLISKSGTKSRNLIVPRLAGHKFQTQIVKLLQQAGYRIVTLDLQRSITIKTLIHVRTTWRAGSHPAFGCNNDALQYLSGIFKNKAKAAVRASQDLAPEILWIDRKLTRKIERSDEIIAKLKTRCRVNVVALEELDLAEQLRLFSASDFVVGVHGAGFTNLSLLDQHSIKGVFEVFSPGNGTPTYRILASALRIRHGAYVGTRCETAHPNYPNISVDTEDFVASLLSFIEQPAA